MQDPVCRPKNVDKVDAKLYEKFIKWFKKEIQLMDREKALPSSIANLDLMMSTQISAKKINCKRDYVFAFVIFLRAIGIDARLIVSANVSPKRPGNCRWTVFFGTFPFSAVGGS